jgi:hypothetical protein
MDRASASDFFFCWGGAALLLQAFRSLGLPRSVGQHVHVKQRDRGYDEASMVESFVVLHALGGDCLEDFARLREETGLRQMRGHELPSPEAARNFLYQFHDKKLIEKAQQERVAPQGAYIPDENAARQGLGRVNDDLLREMGGAARRRKSPRWIKTAPSSRATRRKRW